MGAVMVALLLAAQGTQPPESQWVEIARDDRTTDYIDARTIQVMGDRRTVWHRRVYAQPIENGAVVRLYNVEMDCRLRTQALLAGRDSDASGRLVESHDYPAPNRIPVRPGSLGELVFNAVCRPNSN